jgi:hypothetical protein
MALGLYIRSTPLLINLNNYPLVFVTAAKEKPLDFYIITTIKRSTQTANSTKIPEVAGGNKEGKHLIKW